MDILIWIQIQIQIEFEFRFLWIQLLSEIMFLNGYFDLNSNSDIIIKWSNKDDLCIVINILIWIFFYPFTYYTNL